MFSRASLGALLMPQAPPRLQEVLLQGALSLLYPNSVKTDGLSVAGLSMANAP